MADGISADFEELRRLGADIGEVVVNAGPYINSAVQVTSGKIKDDARESVKQGNRRWRALPGAISYEIKTFQGFGASVIEADIGYNKDRPAGRLGVIREYGSPSAPPHNDLLNALEKNQADFEEGLDKALQEAERVLTGGSSVMSAARSIIKGRLE